MRRYDWGFMGDSGGCLEFLFGSLGFRVQGLGFRV